MIKRFRAKHPILYCIFASLCFMAIMLVGVLAIFVGSAFIGLDWIYASEEVYGIVQELIGLAVALFFLQRTGKLELITRRGCGFFDGILVGMYPFFLIAYSMIFGLLDISGSELVPVPDIICYLAEYLLVGVAEEFMARAVIAETLLEHFGTSRAGIWKACLLSGLIFGCWHLTNMMASEAFGVLMQCAFAFALGTLFAAIYFRTGNIWVVVFLHGMMDIASTLEMGLCGIGDFAQQVSSYDISTLTSLLVYLIPLLFILRKKKIGEVKLYFGKKQAA